MNRRERIVNTYLAERLRRIRRERRVTLPDLAEIVGLSPSTCYAKEAGLRPIGLDYLLRFHVAMGLRVQDVWFPAFEEVGTLDDDVIRSLLGRAAKQHLAVSEEDAIEIAAAVFQVPVHAITEGFQQKRIVQARTAAALVVRSHPLMKMERLARLVRRTSACLRKARYRAAKYGPDFWRKAEAVQQQLDEL